MISFEGGIWLCPQHSKQDREKILLTGTLIDAATIESGMLQKWKLACFFIYGKLLIRIRSEFQ